MPSRFSRLRDLVWTAIAAVVMGGLSVTTAVFGASAQVSLSLGVFGVILSVLTPR